MYWADFEHGGVNYSLRHLHPCGFDLIIPAQGLNPERSYRLNVIFSLHCFTRGAREGEIIPPDWAYRDSRETRIFDLERYRSSFDLPRIVTSLSEAKCFHDKHGNFYVFETVDTNGVKQYYSVFFTLSRAGGKMGLNLFISSAHLRAKPPYAHSLKPIRFRVLVHNTWMGKAIKPAP